MTGHVDVWDVQREQRRLSTERNAYDIYPCPRSIRHATKTLGMDRNTAAEGAFQSMHRRDPARWGGPGA